MSEGATLEYTPTWVVAAVCTVMVAASMELMLLGFVSLLLTVCQNLIAEICISKTLAKTWLPCRNHLKRTPHLMKYHLDSLFSSYVARHGVGRHLLSSSSSGNYCAKQGKVALLSATALHHLHIFIFVLAVAHVTFCALTVLFGGAKISQWKQWEDDIADEHDQKNFLNKFTNVHEHDFVKDRFEGVGKKYALRGWWHAFLMQFCGSITKSDYTTLRLGFIMNHCRSYPKFNFHNYVMRSFEDDFKKVVGIGWYCWTFVVLFLLANVHDLHAYFWISFIPFLLLIAVGTKLEHIITQLATEVAQKHMAVEGDLIVKPSDHHFWLNRPKFVLLLIHVTLFQNSFEIAVFFWIWVQYGFESCIMGNVKFIIPRLFIGAFVQFICSYSTLPLYAIVARIIKTKKGVKEKSGLFRKGLQKEVKLGVSSGGKKNGGEVGKPLAMDRVTEDTCRLGYGRIGYARILVEVDTTRKLSEVLNVCTPCDKPGVTKMLSPRPEYRVESGDLPKAKFVDNEGFQLVTKKSKGVSQKKDIIETNGSKKLKEEFGSSKAKVAKEPKAKSTISVSNVFQCLASTLEKRQVEPPNHHKVSKISTIAKDKETVMEEESEMGNSDAESDKASMVEFIKEGAVDLSHP
ncbi:hypothetical protein Pint_26488 [Pistacia integerrima]|uniref:Uncharacterized protein n=1 Tax=Pistacia integerrima TaxID=434235 RepID=A0ACC0YI49_9ROSI|nr:hypothetical protein Pint_26488 [Pistacia integerrima]